MPVYLAAAQIIVALVVIVALLMQVRGGGLGGIFGQADTVFRTRRGIQKTLLRFTILMMVFFIVIAIFSVRSLSS